MLSGGGGRPQATFASKLETGGGASAGSREGDQGAERDEGGAGETDQQAAADGSDAAFDQQAGEPAAGEDADVGGEIDDPRDAQRLLVEPARVVIPSPFPVQFSGLRFALLSDNRRDFEQVSKARG